MASPSKRARNQRTIAVLLPAELHAAVHEAAGRDGVSLAEWMRAVLRRAVGKRLDFESGYLEGKSAAWSDVSARVRQAFQRAFEE